MFDEKNKQAYRQITAPASLYSRIAAEQPKPRMRGIWRPMAAAAMVLCLCLIIFPLLGQNESVEVLLDDVPLSSDAAVLPAVRTAVMLTTSGEPVSVRLMLSAEKETTVTVSDGTVKICDPQDNSIRASGKEGVADGPAWLLWELTAAQRDAVYTMRLESGKTNCTVFLQYDDTVNAWTVCRKNSDGKN